MKNLILNGLFCLALSVFAISQQPQTETAPAAPAQSTTAAAGNNSAPASNSQANIYVYRYKQYVGSALSPSVYCDETELARMENGRFFVAKLAPGKHVFRSNDKQAGIEVDLKAGQDYYIRMELATGFMKGHGRLVLVAPEQGSYEVKKLKPLDESKIKDNQHVSAAASAGN